MNRPGPPKGSWGFGKSPSFKEIQAGEIRSNVCRYLIGYFPIFECKNKIRTKILIAGSWTVLDRLRCSGVFFKTVYWVYIYIPWAPKTMKNKGFGQLRTRLFTINTSKNVGLGGPWYIYILCAMSCGDAPIQITSWGDFYLKLFQAASKSMEFVGRFRSNQWFWGRFDHAI